MLLFLQILQILEILQIIQLLSHTVEFHGIHRSPIEYGRIQIQCEELEFHDFADSVYTGDPADSVDSAHSGDSADYTAPVAYN